MVGRAHDLKGQALAAFVTLKEGRQPTAALKDDLKDHVVKKIGAIARPDDILFSADLPKTRSGKIMRRLLKDIAEGRTLGDPETVHYGLLPRYKLAGQFVVDLRRDLGVQRGQVRVQGRGDDLLVDSVCACGRDCAAHSSPPFFEAYSSAESSGPSESAATLKSQPAPYGSLLISAGSSTTRTGSTTRSGRARCAAPGRSGPW